MRDGSSRLGGEVQPRRPLPYLTGISAQRWIELLTLRLAPAFAAAAIVFTRVDSEWQTLLMAISMLLVSVALRPPHIPYHLIPFASATLYLLVAPIGAALALGISHWTGSGVSQVGLGDMVAPVLGAWAVTAVGGWVTHGFRRDREVRLAVIGSHEFARGLEAELEAVGVHGYRVVGCIDPEQSCAEPARAGIRCLGSLPLLRTTILDQGIELLVLGPLTPSSAEPAEGQFQASGASRLEVFERVADACLDLPVSMLEAGQLYEELFGHVPLGTTTSAWFQYLLHPRYRGSWQFSKRLLDLGIGSLAAVLAAPILILAALAIKLTDHGPVLHSQRRIGEAGREIELVKLRTMSENQTGPRWTGNDDDRITFVGGILRRLHIDELPQLWLVLRGQMSLVGPRPEQPTLVSELESEFSYYDRRHLVKPGITGWAQVRCGYSGSRIGSAWKLCHDLYYLKRRSALFDLLIMIETLSTVIVPEPIKRPDERFIVSMRASGEPLRGTVEGAVPMPHTADV
jgi:lipopolysaccharide/colanic/teichoic acid biosynthesis glycosyltransferase